LTSPALEARVEISSFDYRRAQVSTGRHAGNLDWFIAGSEFHQDGFRDHPRQNTQGASGNLGWQIFDVLETRLWPSSSMPVQP
jgi:iron complex outermembrane receptor protein